MLNVLLFILLVLSVLLVLWLIDQIRILSRMEAPLVLTPFEVIDEIVDEIKLSGNSIVYELGCGDARVLCALAKKYPQAKFVGIDRLFFAVILAKLRCKREGLKNIEIRFGDMFKTDLSSVSHIFLWIYPWMMDKLLPKLIGELKHGALVYSVDFGFKDFAPEANYMLKGNKKSNLAKKLLVHKF